MVREIEADDGSTGWVTNRYITVLVGTDDDFDDTADPDGTPILTRTIGAWNLEHFTFGRSRGFPENTRGGPTYSSRTDAEIQEIASAIRDDLGAAIMVLSEVNGDGQHDSPEMDRLVSDLGGSWNYFFGTTGGNQRLVVLWDENQVVRNACDEFTFADHDVQNKDIFDRDPVACHLSLLDDNGTPANDLVVVALHLASGQSNNENHSEAMERLRQRIHDVTGSAVVPTGERDILLAGDLNANRYDSREEDFWEDFDESGFDYRTLSPVGGDDYPGTRLTGVPLQPRSKIDYIIASGRAGGLTEELVQQVAWVHLGLADGDFRGFRQTYSDHFPITVQIRVVVDDDGN